MIIQFIFGWSCCYVYCCIVHCPICFNYVRDQNCFVACFEINELKVLYQRLKFYLQHPCQKRGIGRQNVTQVSIKLIFCSCGHDIIDVRHLNEIYKWCNFEQQCTLATMQFYLALYYNNVYYINSLVFIFHWEAVGLFLPEIANPHDISNIPFKTGRLPQSIFDYGFNFKRREE